MADAKRDNNNITSLLAVSDVDSSTPVVLEADPTTKRLKVNASITGTVTTSSGAASTATVTSVNDTASSTTLLALNTSRFGATIFNDSTSDLYVKLGTTASTSSFTIKLSQDDYYEVPNGYTGRIDGVWSSDASGAARITELT
jgi:hypothetical protein